MLSKKEIIRRIEKSHYSSKRKKLLLKYVRRYGPLSLIGIIGYGAFKILTGPVRDKFAGSYAPNSNLYDIDDDVIIDYNKNELINKKYSEEKINNININEMVYDKNDSKNYKRKYYKKKNYKKKYYKKKSYKTNKKYYKRDNKKLNYYIQKRIEDALEKNSNVNINTWRNIDSGQISCEVNQCSYSNFFLLSSTVLESAIDGAQVYDPNTNTMVTANLSSIDGIKTKILNAKTILSLRNNAFTPCELKIYWIRFKKRGATAPILLFEDGLENAGITTNELTDLRYDIYDSKTFNDFCKVYKTRKIRLEAGDETRLELCKKTPFMYDPDELDKHTASEYVPGQTQALVIRMNGVISHDDTSTSNVGTCNSTLDYVLNYHIKFVASPSTSRSKHLLAGTGTLDAQAINARVVVDTVEEVNETL